jgi:ribosomal-protein-alanine N-acetyltransferase
MDEVLAIENACFKSPWTEKEFLCALRNSNCIGIVFEDHHRILGFMIYELHKSRLHVLNMAVMPSRYRKKIGSKMVQMLVDQLSQQCRRLITANVRESNLGAQLFFQQCGFRCVETIKNAYDDCAEDAYVMRYRIEQWECDAGSEDEQCEGI